jgi:hypothetical protein
MRLIGALLASLLLVLAFGVQSNLICPAEAAAHHQSPCDKSPKAQTSVCCWDLATCTAPAVPATHTADADLAPADRTVTVGSVGRPLSIVFAPETPPPRV